METFQDSLVGKETTSIIIGAGSTTYSCTDAATAKQITDKFSTCKSFATCGSSQSYSCNGETWQVGGCGGGEISVASGVCSCTGSLAIRPCEEGNSWGGAGSNTCAQSSQTLSITVDYGGN